LEIYISQGSVAIQLRCGGIFSNHFITNFPQNVPVKNIGNRSVFGEDMDKSMWLSFLAHSVGIDTACLILYMCQKIKTFCRFIHVLQAKM